jgi:hypothetical protein
MRSRALSAVLLAGALLATACLWDDGAPAVRDSRLLSDTGGPIERVLLVVSSPRRSGLRNQQLIERIARGLGPWTRIMILADREMILDPNPWPQRLEFVEIPDELTFSIWPQDPFAVLESSGERSRLLAARDYGREQDREMTRVAADRLGWEVVNSSLFFAGGNLLSDERNAFVAAKLIRENALESAVVEDEIRRRFEEELGLPVLAVGQSGLPVAHLDMALTPLGNGRIAVADAAEGARLAERELELRPDSVETFERAAEQAFFGHPSLRTLIDEQGRTLHRPSIVGGTRQAVEESRRIAASLDAVANELSAEGYSVVRIPLLMTQIREDEPIATEAGGREYPMLSYNNVLIEHVTGRDHVYIPEYGWPALDLAARGSWAAAGFEVHAIPGLTTSAIYRGSLRCTVKVLRRGARS